MGDALAPWHIILLAVVLLVLFGSKKLPGAAKSIGESMRIFKAETKKLHDDDQPEAAAAQAPVAAPQAAPTLTAPAASGEASQQQIADLQRQIADLQRQNVGPGGAPVSGGGSLSEPQRSQQPF